jgi:hypothetical protein
VNFREYLLKQGRLSIGRPEKVGACHAISWLAYYRSRSVTQRRRIHNQPSNDMQNLIKPEVLYLVMSATYALMAWVHIAANRM